MLITTPTVRIDYCIPISGEISEVTEAFDTIAMKSKNLKRLTILCKPHIVQSFEHLLIKFQTLYQLQFQIT